MPALPGSQLSNAFILVWSSLSHVNNTIKAKYLYVFNSCWTKSCATG